MNNRFKIPYFSLIPIILISLILYKLVDNIDHLYKGFNWFLSIISYIIWAFAIAYILNPLMVYLEKKLKLKRVFSMIIVYTLFAGCITFFIVVISPIIIRNLGDILENVPGYVGATRDWLSNTISKLDWIDEYNLEQFVIQNMSSFTEKASKLLGSSLDKIISNAITLTSTILKFIFGTMISIYLLKDKEILINSLKKFVYAFVKKTTADRLLEIGSKVNNTFFRFLMGKSIDSLIIGILCFIGLIIIKAPYPLLISVIVAVTNMIPYFGPYFGAVPAIIITLFYSPIKVFWVMVFIFILQQFDGWILGPKIIGDSIGLSPFWIIVSILIGGGAFGVIGMILGVPLMAVVKSLLGEFINNRLRKREVQL